MSETSTTNVKDGLGTQNQPSLLLSIKNLSIVFSTPHGRFCAVENLDLSLSHGEVVGLVGESGCGKSVAGLSILRLLPPPPACEVSGAIVFQGKDLLALSSHSMRAVRGAEISMIFQEPLSALNPVMKIGDQVAEVFRIHHHASRAEAKSKSLEALTLVGLTDPKRRLRQYPHELSGGMRQRVLIAMALACQPKLLIADEPTTALDVTVSAQIVELLKARTTNLGLSVLFITHDLALVARLCQRVVVLYAGRIVEDSPTNELFKGPAHPYTQGLMDCLPDPKKAMFGTDSKLKEMPGRLPDPFSPPLGCRFSPRCSRADALCQGAEPSLTPCGQGSVRCFHPLKEEPGQKRRENKV